MRRTLSILIALMLVLGATALTGCSRGFNKCPTICQPDNTYEYKVGERCFPIDRNGNPYYPQHSGPRSGPEWPRP